MLNSYRSIAEVALYRAASKYTAEDLERPAQKSEARTVQNFYLLLQACMDKPGGHFEHFISQTFVTFSVMPPPAMLAAGDSVLPLSSFFAV